METRRMRLFDGAFWRVMLPLAIPIALQNLLMTSFRLVDTLMIGRLGDTSIAAVGLAGQMSFLVELVVFGMASGSAVFLAQYHGANNRDGIWRTFGATLLFAVPCGLLATLLAAICPTDIMRIFTNDAALIVEGARYLRYAGFSYLGLTVCQAMSTTLRSTERVRVPMVTSMFASALNAVLNYALIFGKLGLPAMGVAGAGLATAISSLSNPLLMLVISIAQKNILIAPLKKLFSLSGGFLRHYWSRVLPVLCNEAVWSLSIVCINMVYGRMGADNYAALTVFRTIENIVFVFFVGVCNAANILVGKSIGAGDFELAKDYARNFMRLVPVFGVVLGGIVILLRGPMLSLFDISETANHTARMLLLIYGVEVSFRNIPYMAVVGIFRAGGDTKIGLLSDGLVQYVLVLPTVALCGLVLHMPFLWTYVCMLLVDDVVKCTIMLVHFNRMRWIRPVTAPPGTDAPALHALGGEKDAEPSA